LPSRWAVSGELGLAPGACSEKALRPILGLVVARSLPRRPALQLHASVADRPTERCACARRSTTWAILVHVTVEEYKRLVAAGVIDRVELIDGEIRMGEPRLAFSASQIQAAAELRFDLTDEQVKALGPRRESRRKTVRPISKGTGPELPLRPRSQTLSGPTSPYGRP
jgi:hypothetical protein